MHLLLNDGNWVKSNDDVLISNQTVFLFLFHKCGCPVVKKRNNFGLSDQKDNDTTMVLIAFFALNDEGKNNLTTFMSLLSINRTIPINQLIIWSIMKTKRLKRQSPFWGVSTFWVFFNFNFCVPFMAQPISFDRNPYSTQ